MDAKESSLLIAILKAIREFFHFLEELIESFGAAPGPAAKLQVVLGGTNTMNVTLAVGQQVPFYVTGTDANGVRTGAIATGATLAVNVSDSAKVSIVADITPQVAPDGGPSIASGVATALAVGTVTLLAIVTNADGTAGPTSNGIIAVTPVAPPPAPGPATGTNIAFGGVR